MTNLWRAVQVEVRHMVSGEMGEHLSHRAAHSIANACFTKWEGSCVPHAPLESTRAFS